jgi:lipopolysaccharide/colanic/teichoic acid biosynthesis glycosyltransferase
MRQALEAILASLVLAIAAPAIAVALIAVWLEDGRWPIYASERIGKGRRPFRMYKIRSMRWNAAASGADSTSDDDPRLTRVGRIVRRVKLDECLQLINVIRGEMRLVGPRPNVLRETTAYTEAELLILTVQPGITDIASIVFSDLGAILKGHSNADLAYSQLVRPRKSRLALFYVEKRSIKFDLQVLLITGVGLFSHALALSCVRGLLARENASPELIGCADRSSPLVPMAPPGTDRIVLNRNRVDFKTGKPLPSGRPG